MSEKPTQAEIDEANASRAHCMCAACRNGVLHSSDCAVHNMPALPNGDCDCGASRELNALMDAAEAYAEVYVDDGRDCIQTDVLNAFYAGAKFAEQSSQAALAEKDRKIAELVEMVEKMRFAKRQAETNASDAQNSMKELTRRATEQAKLLAVMREALQREVSACEDMEAPVWRGSYAALSATSETVEKYLDEVRADERKLRRMLCACYAGASAYMDDGEAQDSSQMPIIDFMRFTPEQIEHCLLERATAELRAKKGDE